MCVACRRLRAACGAIADVGLGGLMVMPVLLARELVGEVPERLNGHAWKACVGRPTAGSNPVLSARLVWFGKRVSTPTVGTLLSFLEVGISAVLATVLSRGG